jgi:hypothetical protein
VTSAAELRQINAEETALELARANWVNALRHALDIRRQELIAAPTGPLGETLHAYRAHRPDHEQPNHCHTCGQHWRCTTRHELGITLITLGHPELV